MIPEDFLHSPDIQLHDGKKLTYRVGAPGRQIIYWPKFLGSPAFSSKDQASCNIQETAEDFVLSVDAKKTGVEVVVE